MKKRGASPGQKSKSSPPSTPPAPASVTPSAPSPTPLAATSAGPVLTMQRQLAKLMDVSDKTVCLWVRRPDWPVGRKPPWGVPDLDRIRKWRGELQDDRGSVVALAGAGGDEDGGGEDEGDGDDLFSQLKGKGFSKVRLAKETEQLLLARVKRELLEGKYVERKLLDDALVALTRVFVQELENLERALPLQVAGKDPGQVEKITRLRFAASRTRLADQQSIELQKVEEAIKAKDKAKPRGRPSSGSPS